jgi:hypothetical protein
MLFLVLLLIVFLLGLWIGFWIFRKSLVAQPPPPPPSKDPGCPPPQIEDSYTSAQLAPALGIQLVGMPADGSQPPATPPSGAVIWVDQGDEVLVHLESTQVRLQDNCLLISVDLETDQTGRQPLIMAFSISDGTDGAGLIATTDDLPRGNGFLASRWRHVLQSAIWASILNMSKQHAFERQQAPNGISIANDMLHFHAGEPVVAMASTAVQS